MTDQTPLKARQLAVRLGVGISTVYRMSSAGLIPSIPVGAKLSGRRFDESEVRDALSKQVVPLRKYHPPKAKRKATVLDEPKAVGAERST